MASGLAVRPKSTARRYGSIVQRLECPAVYREIGGSNPPRIAKGLLHSPKGADGIAFARLRVPVESTAEQMRLFKSMVVALPTGRDMGQ